MKPALSRIILCLTLSFGSQTLFAKCSKSNVCDDLGQNCEAIDICDNLFDAPAKNFAPLTPMPTLKFKPLPSLRVPPIGTTQCDYMQVNGRWQNVCG